MKAAAIAEQGTSPKTSDNRSLWPHLIVLLFVALGVRLALSQFLLNDFDRIDFVATAHKTLRYGVARYYEPSTEYHGVKNDRGERGVPLTYPPIQIYCYWVVGQIYDRIDPNFREISFWKDLPVNGTAINYLVKVPLFVFDLLITTVIFAFLRGRFGDQPALICAGLYALNPAVLFDGALWAQPDSIHSGFLVMALVFLALRRPVPSLVMMALALLSKPQPMIFAPLVFLVIVLAYSFRKSLTAIACAAFAVLVVFLPLLLDPARIQLIENMLSVTQG
jgi:hypothetical protein